MKTIDCPVACKISGSWFAVRWLAIFLLCGEVAFGLAVGNRVQATTTVNVRSSAAGTQVGFGIGLQCKAAIGHRPAHAGGREGILQRLA